MVHGLLLPWPGSEEIREVVREQKDFLVKAVGFALRYKVVVVKYDPRNNRLFIARFWSL